MLWLAFVVGLMVGAYIGWAGMMVWLTRGIPVPPSYEVPVPKLHGRPPGKAV